jgi:Tol biopolymer transport system component
LGDWKEDHLVFSSGERDSRHIWIATIDPRGFHLKGPVRQLTFGTGIEADPSIASNGRIAFWGLYYHDNLWRLSLRPGDSSTGGLDRISSTGAFDTHPSISADGKKMAFLSRRTETRQVLIHDFGSGKESSLTIGLGDKSSPVISPDGSMVAYSESENGKPSIYVVPTDNSRPGGPRRVCENCGTPSDWIPGLSGILYTSGVPQSVYRLNLASGISTPILRNPASDLDQPHISPDGRWIAFVGVINADRARICLSPLDIAAAIPPNRWIAVTDGNSWDDKPRWLNNNSLIFYSKRDRFGCIWKQQLDPRTMQPAGIPEVVHHFHELRRSPRTLYRNDFEIAVTRDFLVLNMVESFGNIWLTSLPR